MSDTIKNRLSVSWINLVQSVYTQITVCLRDLESVSDGSYGKPAAPNASPKSEEPIELVSDICEFAVGKCFEL